jgi:hypothetical protein
MTGYGKRGKTTTGFPLFPQLLEIAARFPHSLNSDDGPVEKWKSNNSIPTFPPPSLLSPLEDSQKGDSSVPELSPPFGLIVGLEYAPPPVTVVMRLRQERGERMGVASPIRDGKFRARASTGAAGGRPPASFGPSLNSGSGLPNQQRQAVDNPACEACQPAKRKAEQALDHHSRPSIVVLTFTTQASREKFRGESSASRFPLLRAGG